jgi:O-antigen/teichoic acid export membrane protein
MPSGHIKSLSKDILIYGAGNFSYSLMQLICMPIIIREMSISEIGAWNILLPTGLLLSALVTFGMDSSLVRFVVDKNEEQKKTIFSTGFYFVITLGLIISFLLWGFTSQTMQLFNIPTNYSSAFWILLAWLPGIVASQFFQKWVQYNFQRLRFVFVLALQSAIYLFFVIFLKATDQINLQNVMFASLISVWIPGMVGLYFCRKMIGVKFDKDTLKNLLFYGAPFMVLAFGINLIFSFDKFVLTRNASPEEFAIYSQAFRVAAIFSMIVSSFNFAFGPFSLSTIKKDDSPIIFKKVKTCYLFFMCFIGTIFMALGKPIILFLSGFEFIEGYKYLPVFILGYIYYGLYSFSQLGIIYSKKSYLGLYSLTAGLLVTIGLELLLVHPLKGLGTETGFALGILTMVLSANVLSKKYLHIPSNTIKDGILISIFLVFSLIFTNFLTISDLYMDSLAKLSIAAIVFGSLLFSSLFKSDSEGFRQIFLIIKLKPKSS